MFFHYVQMVWQKIQDLGRYFDNVPSTVKVSEHAKFNNVTAAFDFLAVFFYFYIYREL